MSQYDDDDDYPEDEPVRRRDDLGDDPAIRMLLPVGRSASKRGWTCITGCRRSNSKGRALSPG
jgi:hypothetical protein